MTPTQEAVMRQALEALEYYQHRRIEWDYSDEAVITALRAELAQDALDRMAANARELGLDYDPVQEPDLSLCPNCGGPADNGYDRSIPPSPYWCTKCMAEPVQEPVAWRYVPSEVWGDPIITQDPKTVELARQFGRPIDPLYTAPPQRKPLPLKEVERLIYEHTKINPNVADDRELLGYIVNAVRDIERAHGIGVQDE